MRIGKMATGILIGLFARDYLASAGVELPNLASFAIPNVFKPELARKSTNGAHFSKTRKDKDLSRKHGRGSSRERAHNRKPGQNRGRKSARAGLSCLRKTNSSNYRRGSISNRVFLGSDSGDYFPWDASCREDNVRRAGHPKEPQTGQKYHPGRRRGSATKRSPKSAHRSKPAIKPGRRYRGREYCPVPK